MFSTAISLVCQNAVLCGNGLNLILPKWQILDSSKSKEFADDIFKFDENDGKFYRRVENTVGKREIAHYEQFLLLPQCFQKTCTADKKDKVLFRKGFTKWNLVSAIINKFNLAE